MADRYTRSTDGSDVDDGTTWALAKATLTGVAAIDTVGDRLFVSQSHAESTAGAVSLSFAGTLASPTLLLCGNDAIEPPTALATTATVATSGANSLTVSGHLYAYGITFNSGTGNVSTSITLCLNGGEVQRYDNCVFQLVGTDANGNILPCGVNNDRAGTLCVFNNCNVKLTHADQAISIHGGLFEWRGGSLVSGSITTSGLVKTDVARPGVSALIDGVDLSAGAATMGLTGTMSAGCSIVFRNCKLPASWTGALCQTSPPAVGARAEMWNCNDTDTNYRMWIEDYCGSIKSETILVKTSGSAASHNGASVPLASRMVTSANAEYPLHILRSQELFSKFITSTGSKTITVDILSFAQGAGPNGALRDDQVWIELQYLGTSGTPLALFGSDAKTDVLASAADQTTNSVAWDSLAAAYSAATNYVANDVVRPTTPNGAVYMCTTDAGTTAAEPTWGTTDGGTTVDAAGRTWTRCNRQQINKTITVNEEGVVIATVCVAAASLTRGVYFDREVQVA